MSVFWLYLEVFFFEIEHFRCVGCVTGDKLPKVCPRVHSSCIHLTHFFGFGSESGMGKFRMSNDGGRLGIYIVF